ncbi:hypothetical protein GCM10028807_50360 [Spirosoma daeguense]
MIWGCTSKKEQFIGIADGKSYTFYTHTVNRIFNKAYYQSLQLAGIQKPLPIDDKTTSPGYPYSLEVYKNVPHVVIDSVSHTYQNNYDESGKNFAVLYVNPQDFSRRNFEDFAHFFQTEWLCVKTNVALQQGYRSLNIVALVYGTDEQFTHHFANGKESIDVWTDGAIYYDTGNGSLESTNLSKKVQMPGEIIAVQKNGKFSLADLKNYRDKINKSLSSYFQLKEE